MTYLKHIAVQLTLICLLVLSGCEDGNLNKLNDEAILAKLGITSITIQSNEANLPTSGSQMPIGETAQLQAIGSSPDGDLNVTSSVEWTTSNISNATINSAGLLTSIAVDPTLTITASIAALSDATFVVNLVDTTPDSITLRDTNDSDIPTQVFPACSQYQYKAIADFDGGTWHWDYSDKVTWVSGDPAITISSTGLATHTDTSFANAETSTILSATYTSVTPDTITATIEAIDAADFVITSEFSQLDINKTSQLTATATRSDNSTDDVTSITTWTVDNSVFASVGATTGLVTALKEGAPEFTATCGATAVGTIIIGVADTPTVVRVEINKIGSNEFHTLKLPSGQQLLSAKAILSNGTSPDITQDDNSTWTIRSISDGEVIRVNNSGTNKVLVEINGLNTGIAEVVLTYNIDNTDFEDDVIFVVE